MSSSSKRKLTLSVDGKRIKTLKVKAIQYELTVSKLVELFALVAERDKKLFKESFTKLDENEVPEMIIQIIKNDITKFEIESKNILKKPLKLLIEKQ